MKKRLLPLLLLTHIYIFAQENKYYEKGIGTYWVHESEAIIQENDTTFTLCVNSINMGEGWRGQLIKTNTYGDILFSATYSSPPPYNDFKVFDMVATSYGYAIIGAMENVPDPIANPQYGYVLATDSEGNILNLANIGLEDYSTRFLNVFRDKDTGDLILSGYRIIGGQEKLYLAKTDELGNIIWQKTDFGYEEYRNLFLHLTQQEGYYYLSAFINNDVVNEEGDMLLLKIDGDGNILWEKVLDLGTIDYISEFLITPDKEFFCTGEINDTDAVFKLDSLGNMIWQNTTAYLNCGAWPILQLTDKSFITSGCTAEEVVWGSAQLPLMKFSNDGEVLWKRYYGGNGNDYGYDMIFMDGDTTGKSGYVVTGRTYTGSGDLAYLVRTNCMGLVAELPNAEFSLSQPQTENPLFIQLENTSTHVYPDSIDGGAYTWTLGDGQKLTTTSEAPLEHTYENDGVYTVTLTALVCNDTSRLSKTVCINANPSPSNITYARAEANPNTLHFHADHPNAPDSLLWTFSNGTTSTEGSPTPTFDPDSVGATLTVSLTTYICEDTLTTTRTIDLWAVGIDENEVDKMAYFIGELHPNPAQTIISLKHQFGINSSATFDLYDLNGHLLQRSDLKGSGVLQLDISPLATGLYFYQVKLDNVTIRREKLVVTK